MRLFPTLKYPKPRRAAVVDVLHGIPVEDPYRWMEDPDSEETRQFVREENAISEPFLKQCANRDELKQTLNSVMNYAKFSAPVRYGDFYYYERNTGLQNQSVVYRKRVETGAKEEVFLDPNTFSEDGTSSLSSQYISSSGKYFAYAVSEAGSDWKTIRIRDTATKLDLPDKIDRFRYSTVAWSRDENGFFYGQYPDRKGERVSGTDTKAALNQKIFYHRVGTAQSDDILIGEFPEHPRWRFRFDISNCGEYLIISAHEDTLYNRIYIADIPKSIDGCLKTRTLYGKFDCEISFLANNGKDFYWHTNKDRPNFGIVKINIDRPDDWIDIIKEDKSRNMMKATVRGQDKIVAKYIQDVSSKIEIFNLEGERLQQLPFGFGNIEAVYGHRNSSEVFFTVQSFKNPRIVYKSDISLAPKAKIEEYERTDLGNWSTQDLEYKQEFFRSKDGTRIPMYVMHRANQTLDGSSPGFLYVYGGFGIPVPPTFSMFNLMLIYTLGFVVSIANVRGGGEYGKLWHDAGRLSHKQNTLDDVHAAAMFLAHHNYTSADRLALHGRSNGGMVTLASINQRPELFGAAIAGVAVADLFRFHKFTIGYAWIADYGNPDNETDFTYIRKISPLHNIPTSITNYPALLVTTADHDDRVVPSHSLKFIAELQYRLGENNTRPLLSLIDTKAGHGSGKPTGKLIEDYLNQLCFLSRTLSLKPNVSKFSTIRVA